MDKALWCIIAEIAAHDSTLICAHDHLKCFLAWTKRSASSAFGITTEIGEMGQWTRTRNMIYRNGLYRTGELGSLNLLEAAFLEMLECTSNWKTFVPFSDSQITACLETVELAKMAGKHYNSETQVPRWHSDKKFSHLLQSMKDHLSTEDRAKVPEVAVTAITATVDEAIRADLLEDAIHAVTIAVIERTSALLFVPQESIQASKSIAEYGVDSVVAVELSNWFVSLFRDTIPLLKLLDESVSIAELVSMIVKKRKA